MSHKKTATYARFQLPSFKDYSVNLSKFYGEIPVLVCLRRSHLADNRAYAVRYRVRLLIVTAWRQGITSWVGAAFML